jgi:hypothetical protein
MLGRSGGDETVAMSERKHAQAEAALQAAEAREAIARRIATLAPRVKDQAGAQVVLHLAQAYAALAAEPPRTRAEA